MTEARRQLGSAGEGVARRHLEARGFSILDANFRTRHGELDVVARDDRYLVFCEVKTRVLRGERDALGPFAAIGAEKRRRVRAMAREWLAARPAAIGAAPPSEVRFDAIGVTYGERGELVAIDHLEDAF